MNNHGQIAIKLNNISKIYKLYDNPVHRLKESLHPLRKVYHREFYALNPLSIEIKKGECVGLIGKNGSGKSTLLKIITGIITPSSGERIVNGKVSALLELGTGFNPELTGIENIYLNGSLMGYSREEINFRLQGILDFADIGDFIYQPVKMYSSGMFARLAFSVAVSVEPEILIVDEVLSVGDARFQIKCINKMEELKDNGTTILFVTHATEQIKRFCKRGIWINNGSLIEDGDAVYVADKYEEYMEAGQIFNTESNKKSIMKESLNIDTENPSEISLDPNGENDLSELIIENKDQNQSSLCKILNVKIIDDPKKTFDKLTVEVEYKVFDKKIDDLLCGVAIYGKGRRYIFGPNTYLDKFDIPNTKGIHKIRYNIPKLTLLAGTYFLDIGFFINGGIVNLDYITSGLQIEIQNDYFTEGSFFIEHNWEVLN